jgi:hypothetical protein
MLIGKSAVDSGSVPAHTLPNILVKEKERFVGKMTALIR